MVVVAFLLHPVEVAFQPFCCRFQVDIKNYSKVWPGPFKTSLGDFYDLIDSESASVALISTGAGQPPVEDDTFILF